MYNRMLGSRLWLESGETEAYVVWIKTDGLGGWAGLKVRRKKIVSGANKQSERDYQDRSLKMS